MPNLKAAFLSQLARRPGYAMNAVRNLDEARRSAHRRGTDPVMLQIEVTSRCNYKCSYCIVHNGSSPEVDADMQMDTFQRVLEKFPSAFYLQLQGQGEPLLHSKLEEMVRLAEDQRRFVGIVTNGSLWSEAKTRELLAAGVDMIAFSLDLATPDEMQSIRRGMNVAKVVENLQRVLRLRDELRPSTVVGVSAVLLRHVYEDMKALRQAVEWLDGLGIDFLMVDPLAGTESYRTRYPSAMLTERIDSLGTLRLLPFATRCAVYEAPEMNTFAGHCMWPWMAVYVNYDGSIARCSNAHRVTVGHIDDGDPLNLGHHVEMRRDFAGGGVPPGCYGCQYLLARTAPEVIRA
jgi:MoaA/NifB/PqqE/SkfB family radical SAM enzyme